MKSKLTLLGLLLAMGAGVFAAGCGTMGGGHDCCCKDCASCCGGECGCKPGAPCAKCGGGMDGCCKVELKK